VFRMGSILVTLLAVGFVCLIPMWTGASWSYVVSTVAGMIVGIAIGFITDYYTMGAPIKEIAKLARLEQLPTFFLVWRLPCNPPFCQSCLWA